MDWNQHHPSWNQAGQMKLTALAHQAGFQYTLKLASLNTMRTTRSSPSGHRKIALIGKDRSQVGEVWGSKVVMKFLDEGPKKT